MHNNMIIEEIFCRFKSKTPAPRTELEYKNNFTLLVAIILSAQATDIAVNKATKNLFLTYDTPLKILDLGEEGLKNFIKSIGLYNSKAKNIIKLCSILINDYNNQIPHNLLDLEKLPGVGSKTAKVFLNCAFHESLIAVDTHVFRVSNRLGLIQATNVQQAEKLLPQVIPPSYHIYAHHWLILHGRYICKAKKPECNNCLLQDLCKFKTSNTF